MLSGRGPLTLHAPQMVRPTDVMSKVPRDQPGMQRQPSELTSPTDIPGQCHSMLRASYTISY